jgi:hypothetical protein
MLSDATEEKERPGMPKYYYWAKHPPKSMFFPGGFVNKEQKKFYFAIAGFTVAKVLALLLIFLLIVGRL